MRELVRPVATLLSGSVLAQFVIYAARPLLTRLFTPEAFGLFGFYIATVAVLASVSTGKYDDAVVLPADHGDGWSLVGASLLMTFGVATVILALLPLRVWLAGMLKNPEAAQYLVWLPISVILVGTVRVFDSWLTRLKVFSGVAMGRVGYAFVSTPTQIAAGAAGTGAGGLIGGIIGGQAAQGIILAARGLVQRRRIGSVRFEFHRIRRLARRYRRFAIFGAPASAFNVASVQTPALMLLFFFDAAVLGHYSVAYASLGVPLTLLGAAVAQVYYVNATEAVRTGRLSEITEAVTTRLGAVGLFPLAAIVVAGPDLFDFVFGDTWRVAGDYARFLSPWIFFLLLAAPLSRLFDVLEKQRELLVYNAVLLTARVASLVVGGLAGSDRLAIGLFGASGALLSLVQVVWMINLSGWPIRRALVGLFRFAPVSLPLLLITWIPIMLGASAVVVSGATLACALANLGIIHRMEPGLFSYRSPATK